jgi:nitrogen fixation/metabolism regulation signal transduction histidine kinase
MKNLLILIVFIAVFLHFYPQPKLNNWFEEQKATVLDKFSKATDTKVRLKSDKIFTDLKDEFKSFSEEEVAFVKDITSSREKVEDFFGKYCKNKGFNGNLRTAHLKTVCAKIERYQSLF